jgi:hypothetical protein
VAWSHGVPVGTPDVKDSLYFVVSSATWTRGLRNPQMRQTLAT